MIREEYKPLREFRLGKCASYFQAEQQALRRTALDSPALDVMTDLRRVQAITIGPEATIAAVGMAMMRNVVRSLLVADERRCVLGIITSTDILGEKPMQVVRERGMRHEEVLVRDIMTPWDRLEVLDIESVLTAEVGHVVATLKRSGRQHALAVEEDIHGRHMIRGIFSASQIARQLEMTIDTIQIASTFAEIEAAIAH
ncbi:MAG: CBS domain-containing protein [Rhodocyclaceae bacterium]|jgi:CBS-domain-containing membrane protein|nr:hypothetical protein [Rhodocyclaceae bacterium]MBZ0142248.1 CBS domain-containing protein [Rhodocyclaceae bacterium]MCL4681967.1 CBS domain-containing protein [Rhodocyclaceae bacterium]